MLPLTDHGNAKRLINFADGRLRFSPEAGWLVWNGKLWEKKESAAIHMARNAMLDIAADVERINLDGRDPPKELRAWAKTSQSVGKIKSALELARCEPALFTSILDLNPDPWLLNCPNGILDLKTGNLLNHTPDKLCTNITRAPFDADARTPIYDEFLKVIFDGNDELILSLRHMIGYSLTGCTSEQCVFILWGDGANGKSTFLDTIKWVLGGYGAQVPADTVLSKRYQSSVPNDVAMLHDKRFVATSELESGGKLNEARVKALTGDHSYSARFLHHEFFEFHPRFKIWMGTNHKPRITGTDEGIWRRIRLIPFNVTIPPEQQDPTLPARLRQEASGILTWGTVGGLAQQHSGGRMHIAPEIRDATLEYRGEEDVLAEFVEDSIIDEAGHAVPKKHVYTAYQKWSEEHGNKYPLSERKFSKEMARRGFVEKRMESGRMWDHITLTQSAEMSRFEGEKVRWDEGNPAF